MELLEQLRLLRRRWRLLAACVLVAGAAGFLATPAAPGNEQATYRATHQLLRDGGAAGAMDMATVALLVRAGEVPARVAERVGFTGEPVLLAARVALQQDEEAGTLGIVATASSPEAAAELANAFAEETLALLTEQATASQQRLLVQLNEQLATLQAEIDASDAELAAARIAGRPTGALEAERSSKLRLYGAALDQLQQLRAQPPPGAGYMSIQPALPELARAEGGFLAIPASRLGRTLLAMAIGASLGLAAALVAARLDTRLHDASAAAQAFALPVVAEVPRHAPARKHQITSVTDPLSSIAEAHRALRASLLLTPTVSLGQRAEPVAIEPQVVLITSPAPKDGKTTTVANLAATIAETGRSVLVLGCDFRLPEIHRYFQRAVAPGIADVLQEGGAPALEAITRRTTVPGVWLAPSGDGLRNLGDLAAAGRRLIAQARDLADVVLIDTPPLLATNDASELIPACDAVVVVCRIGRTTLEEARRTRTLLERLSASVAGVVAIGAPDPGAAYSSYYRSSSSTSDAPREQQGASLARSSNAARATEDRIAPRRRSLAPAPGSRPVATAADPVRRERDPGRAEPAVAEPVDPGA